MIFSQTNQQPQPQPLFSEPLFPQQAKIRMSTSIQQQLLLPNILLKHIFLFPPFRKVILHSIIFGKFGDGIILFFCTVTKFLPNSEYKAWQHLYRQTPQATYWHTFL